MCSPTTSTTPSSEATTSSGETPLPKPDATSLPCNVSATRSTAPRRLTDRATARAGLPPRHPARAHAPAQPVDSRVRDLCDGESACKRDSAWGGSLTSCRTDRWPLTWHDPVSQTFSQFLRLSSWCARGVHEVCTGRSQDARVRACHERALRCSRLRACHLAGRMAIFRNDCRASWTGARPTSTGTRRARPSFSWSGCFSHSGIRVCGKPARPWRSAWRNDQRVERRSPTWSGSHGCFWR